MNVFADTSGFLALLNGNDHHHAAADRAWIDLLQSDAVLVSTNYVMLETASLLQARFGLQAMRAFQDDAVPMLTMEWVDAELHQAGMAIVLAAARRGLSLTDCVSFEVMRRRGIRKAFTFDRHFREQGFEEVD